MLTRSKENITSEDLGDTKEDETEKEEANLVPLLTGGKLKPYQIKGVKWMISLWQNGLNGILADQMGLGKTIQTIGFLAHLKGNGLDGPYLVIAPLSTLSNWVNEISRFVPSVHGLIYHGNRKEREEIRRKHMPRTMVLPIFLKVLPLKEDHEESMVVYSCVCNLVLSSNSQMLALVPDLVNLFAHVAISPVETPEVKAQIGRAFSLLISLYGNQMQPLLGYLSPTHANALAAIAPNS